MFFKKKSGELITTLDIHSHLVPGVDDGSKNVNESVELIKGMSELGFNHLITTPHIYPGVYPNKEENLKQQFSLLQQYLIEQGIEMKIELGAEYFLHAELIEKVEANIPLLTFKNGYVLFEMSVHALPLNWEEMLFKLTSEGYSLLLAHPERYYFTQENPDLLYRFKELGVKFQLTYSALIGSYGERAYTLSKWMIKRGLVDAIGSDLHHTPKIDLIRKSLKSRELRKISPEKLINNQ